MQLGWNYLYNTFNLGRCILSRPPSSIFYIPNLSLQQVSFTSMDRYVTRKVLAEDKKNDEETSITKSPERTSPQQKRFLSHESKLHNKFQIDKEKFLNMSIADKRKVYKCKKFFQLADLPTWEEFFLANEEKLRKRLKGRKLTSKAEVNETFNKKLTLWRGDITALEIDSIANAANNSLLGGGGVDGAIHNAAGSCLVTECRTLGGCDTGDAKITGGYKLPSKYVIHTVGPIGEIPQALKSCYLTCLDVMVDNKLRSIAFPCISTGIYGYPSSKAADVVLSTVRTWLEDRDNVDKVDRIIFCLFMPQDVALYEELMQLYFPVPSSLVQKGNSDDMASEPDEKVNNSKKSPEKKENTRTPSHMTRNVLKEAEKNSTQSGKGIDEKVSEEVVAEAHTENPSTTAGTDSEPAAKRKPPISSDEISKEMKSKKTDENNAENNSPVDRNSSDSKESQPSPMECTGDSQIKTKL
ncbi:ADP-ribose glycohydrolase MACROD2-like [Ylistrum balloti]|uniref:ADP-ribose glycohydrolase MACROD2-like n=1 Tax=Ylistrum balloti TaxID=509963 RepID=UPI002905A328|nr:ADP-ribose glycohydrolase MACROD2-like [Ylistrum balloti]